MRTPLHLLLLPLLLGSLAYGTRTVRDELGRDVRLPDQAHRLVCLAPSITDTVYGLGHGNDIVGVTDYTKYPPEAKQKPSVGGVINPSIEKLVDLRPDLVLAIGDLNSLDLIRAIEKLGLAVFVINPHGVEGIYQSIEKVGSAIGAQREASDLVLRLRTREAAVRKRVAAKKTPAVFFLLWPDPLITAGRGAFVTELINIAGAKSITEDLPSEWPQFSFESVLTRKPEYLLLIEGSQVTLDGLRHQAGWKNLEAVQKGNIFYTDERIEYPSPVAIDALEDLAKQIHP